MLVTEALTAEARFDGDPTSSPSYCRAAMGVDSRNLHFIVPTSRGLDLDRRIDLRPRSASYWRLTPRDARADFVATHRTPSRDPPILLSSKSRRGKPGRLCGVEERGHSSGRGPRTRAFTGYPYNTRHRCLAKTADCRDTGSHPPLGGASRAVCRWLRQNTPGPWSLVRTYRNSPPPSWPRVSCSLPFRAVCVVVSRRASQRTESFDLPSPRSRRRPSEADLRAVSVVVSLRVGFSVISPLTRTQIMLMTAALTAVTRFAPISLPDECFSVVIGIRCCVQ